MDTRNKGIFLILVSALMFGSYGVWSKLIGSSLGVFYQSWSRSLIIALLLLPFLLWKKQIVPIGRKDWKWIALFLLFTSFTQAPIFYSFTHMDIGSASLLFFVSTLLTMYFVGVAFLGEKLTRIKVISFFLAIIGMYVVFSFSLAVFSLLAALLAVVNGIASGGEVSFSKKLSQKYSALYLTWLSWVIIVITNAPLSFILGETIQIPLFNLVWLYVLGYTAVSIFGFWAVLEGLKYVEASIGGLVGLLEIIFSIVFGVIIFYESLTYKVVLGGVIILVATALPHLHDLWKRFYNKKSDFT